MNDQELAGLSAEMRDAIAMFDADAIPGDMQTSAWTTIRAELLRLARENAEVHNALRLRMQHLAHMRERAEHAEAELTALKRRIEEAPVYKCDADVISGRDYDYISAVLIHDDPAFQYPDIDGTRVALLPVGGEHGMTEAAGE